LELTLQDLLWDQFNEIVANNWAKDDIVDLLLNLLRNSIDKAVKHHLFQKGFLPKK